MNKQSEPSFLRTNFDNIVPLEYDVSELFRRNFQVFSGACEIFLIRHKQILQKIQFLKTKEEEVKKRHTKIVQSNGKMQLKDAGQAIEYQTILTIIEKRLKETHASDKYEYLSSNFLQTIKQMEEIRQRYAEIGEYSLQPNEYISWMNYISEAQMKLNSIGFFSNIIEQTLYDINQLKPSEASDSVKKLIASFASDVAEGLKQLQKQNEIPITTAQKTQPQSIKLGSNSPGSMVPELTMPPNQQENNLYFLQQLERNRTSSSPSNMEQIENVQNDEGQANHINYQQNNQSQRNYQKYYYAGMQK